MVNRREFAAGMMAAAAVARGAKAQNAASRTAQTHRIILKSKHVPADVAVTVYTPGRALQASTDPLPLMLFLHGGNGSDRDLLTFITAIDTGMRVGLIPPMVIATPAAGRSLYMDFKDASQRWETLIIEDLLPLLRKDFATSAERRLTFVGGVSMGGLGSLRLAFKYPDLFGGVAAVEPAIEPALRWEDIGPRVRFWRPETVLAPIFGTPIDREYWAMNNPATIAKKDPTRLFDLPIYLDVGDQDMLYLTEGVEFLHRILFEAGIGHDYRLVHGADHIGPSLIPRVVDALTFVGRQITPPLWINGAVRDARAGFSARKKRLGLPDDTVDPRRIHGKY